jgi:hypothetical protein
MHFNLQELLQHCRILGLSAQLESADTLVLSPQHGIRLILSNIENEDSIVGFEGTPWHTHDQFIFSGQEGRYIELQWHEVLSGLAKGSILICELWQAGALQDRWLIHKDFSDEFQYMEPGEEIRVWRAEVGA